MRKLIIIAAALLLSGCTRNVYIIALTPEPAPKLAQAERVYLPRPAYRPTSERMRRLDSILQVASDRAMREVLEKTKHRRP